jgi:CubicO group peptidase (beta-lactamase class C family)
MCFILTGCAALEAGAGAGASSAARNASRQAIVSPLPTDAEIREMLATRVDVQRRAVGIVVGVTGSTGHRTIAYGVRSLEERRPVDGRTVFDVGSLTKVFTALLLAEDVEHDRLRLDEPVRHCLPASTGMLARTRDRDVTFADLATHTSGLPLRPDNLHPRDPEDKYAGYTEEDLLAFLSTFKPSRPPGAAYEYSNVGYGLLGVALSHCDHLDFATLVRDRITAPLGMADTGFEPTEEMLRREAVGYDTDLHVVRHWGFGALAPAGGLRSTTDDLLKLLDAALGLNTSSLARALRATTSVERPGGMEPATAIALGWNIYRDNGREVVWKNGSVGGYRAFMGYETTSRTGVVALANMQTAEGADDIGLHLLDPAIPVDLTPPRTHRVVAIEAGILNRYTGSYRFSQTDTVTVQIDADHLVVVGQGTGALPVVPEGDDRFYLSAADAELTFGAFVEGHATELVWSQNGADERGMRLH